MNSFRTYDDLHKIIVNNLYKIPLDIDIIVGIPRSGMLPALMIGLLLNKPLSDLFSYLDGRLWISGLRGRKTSLKWKNIKKVLIVDDSINTGFALGEVKNKILKNKNYKHEIIYCCVFVNPIMKDKIDIFFEELVPPRFFQWNFIHHPKIKNACLDIDGVICRDPTEEENDDGHKYIEFLKHAKPLYIPTVPVSCFVTSRLEKYRKYTEYWLNKYNIKYNELIMLDLQSKEERMKQKAYGNFKAEIYKKRKEGIFIESNEKQAELIFEKSKKNVLCLENNKIYEADNYNNTEKTKMEDILKKQKNEIIKIKKSYSYKIGKLVTYAPRKAIKIIKYMTT